MKPNKPHNFKKIKEHTSRFLDKMLFDFFYTIQRVEIKVIAKNGYQYDWHGVNCNINNFNKWKKLKKNVMVKHETGRKNATRVGDKKRGKTLKSHPPSSEQLHAESGSPVRARTPLEKRHKRKPTKRWKW